MDYEYTYPNPVRLAGENNRIFLFWRGNVNEPMFAVSDDGARTFKSIRRFMTSPNKVPYVKVYSRDDRRIHFAFTDAHPRLNPLNSVFYASYVEGKLVRADGSTLRAIEYLPLDVHDAENVYDAKTTGARAWVWDVAADEDEKPIIVYTRFPSETDHRYHYARWDGRAWQDHEIIAAGGYFPETPEGEDESEPYYSGGIVIDHENPSVVYLSRPIDGVFEIERWTTHDFGKSWIAESITSLSIKDNVRPVVVRNHPKGGGPTVLWMRNDKYIHYRNYATSIVMDAMSPVIAP